MTYRGLLASILALVLSTGFGGSRVAGDRAPAASHPVQLVAIHMIGTTKGWALGTHAVLRTSDGGMHGMNVTPHGVAFTASSETPMDFLTRFAGGSTFVQGQIWFCVTHDGGRTWQGQALPLPPAYRATTYDIAPPQFFTPWDGVLVVGIGSILSPLVYVTHDGGRTWTSTMSTTPLRNAVIVSFINVSDGWAVEHDPTAPRRKARLYVTQDGGRHWMTIIPNVRLQWSMLFQFVSRRTGFALRVGSEPKEPSRLFKTVDGGHSWYLLGRLQWHEAR